MTNIPTTAIPQKNNIFGKPGSPTAPHYSGIPFRNQISIPEIQKKGEALQPLQPQSTLGMGANKNGTSIKATGGIFQSNSNQPQNTSTGYIFNQTGNRPANNFSINNFNSPAAVAASNIGNPNVSNPFATINNSKSNSGYPSPPKSSVPNLYFANQNTTNVSTNNPLRNGFTNANSISMTNNSNSNPQGNIFKNNTLKMADSFFSNVHNNFQGNNQNNLPNNNTYNQNFSNQNVFNRQNQLQNVFRNPNTNQLQNIGQNFQQNPQNYQNYQNPQTLSEALPLLVQHSHQLLKNRPQFQNTVDLPNANVHLYAQNPKVDYQIFLNNLLGSDSRSNNPQQLFQLAEGWANRMVQHDSNGNPIGITKDQEIREVMKLFDLKIDPQIHQMKMKDMPPIKLTSSLIQRMNDPFSCKMIVSELWLRLKERYDSIVKSVNLASQNCGSIKIKELPFYKQMLVLRKQISILAMKVNELKTKDAQLKRIQAESNIKSKQLVKRLKQDFYQVNLRMKMIEEATEQLDKIQDYIQKDLKSSFKAYVQKQQASIQDPDNFMLDISIYISKRLSVLDKVLNEHIAIQNDPQNDVNFLELTQIICKFYEQVASKLYDIREKMKKLIKISTKQRSFGSDEDLQKKIQEKAQAIINQKMAIYNKLKEMEDIVQKKKQVRSKGKKEKLSLETAQRL